MKMANGWTYFDNEREPIYSNRTPYDKACHGAYKNGFNAGCQLHRPLKSGYSRADFDNLFWLGYEDACNEMCRHGLAEVDISQDIPF